MTSRRLPPRFAIALLPALAGCAALAVPPNNSTDLGRVYYACDFAVVERVMDLAGVVDQINERERQRTACIHAGGPVAAAPSSVVTLTPPVPEATAPQGSTILAPPEPTAGVGPVSRAARPPAAPTSIVPPPPIAGN